MGKFCENVCKIALPLSHPFLAFFSYSQHPPNHCIC